MTSTIALKGFKKMGLYDRQAKYDAVNTRRYTVKFNRKTDADIFEHIADKGAFQTYIKALIRKDIEASKGGAESAQD